MHHQDQTCHLGTPLQGQVELAGQPMVVHRREIRASHPISQQTVTAVQTAGIRPRQLPRFAILKVVMTLLSPCQHKHEERSSARSLEPLFFLLHSCVSVGEDDTRKSTVPYRSFLALGTMVRIYRLRRYYHTNTNHLCGQMSTFLWEYLPRSPHPRPLHREFCPAPNRLWPWLPLVPQVTLEAKFPVLPVPVPGDRNVTRRLGQVPRRLIQKMKCLLRPWAIAPPQAIPMNDIYDQRHLHRCLCHSHYNS